MFCYKCGFELKDGTNFCGKCGSKNMYTSSITNEKEQTFEASTTSEEITDKETTSSELNTKQNKPKGLIILGVLILVLSIGFGSYYMSFLKFRSTNSKKLKETSKVNKVTTKDATTDNNSNVKTDAAVPAKKTDTNNINTTGLYIFPKSGSEKLLDSDVSILTKEDLTLARNEIYARHGLVFKGEQFNSYFSKKPWYKPNPNFKASDVELDNIELYNIQLISKYENK